MAAGVGLRAEQIGGRVDVVDHDVHVAVVVEVAEGGAPRRRAAVVAAGPADPSRPRSGPPRFRYTTLRCA